MGAVTDLLGLLASPFGAALVISSGLFCSIAARSYARVQRRLDACQHRLEGLRREHQRLQQRLLEQEPGRGAERPSKGLETLGRDGGLAVSIVVLLLLLALNLLALFFGWHGRRLDDQIAACEVECRRLEAQNVALSRALAVAEAAHPPASRPAPGEQE